MRSRKHKVVPGIEDDDENEWVIATSGVRLRVRVSPPLYACEDHKAIFFIHGVAGSSEIWNRQINFFSREGFHVIAPDLIGHGFSGAPDDSKLYTFQSLCSDLIDIFDHYKKDFNIIIGHSYGTSFAAYLARHRSSRISKLVLMSGGAPVSLAPQPGLLSLPKPVLGCFRPLLIKLFYRSRVIQAKAFISVILFYFSKAFYKKNRNLTNQEAAFNVPLYVLKYTMKGQVWSEGGEEFHKWIAQPVLLLHGECDLLEQAQNTQVMHEVLPRSEFHVVKESGHMIMMEQPDVVNHLILRFLAQDFCGATKPILSSPVASPRTPTHHRGDGEDNSHNQRTKSQPNLRHKHYQLSVDT